MGPLVHGPSPPLGQRVHRRPGSQNSGGLTCVLTRATTRTLTQAGGNVASTWHGRQCACHVSQRTVLARVAELAGATHDREGRLGYQREERSEVNLALTVWAVRRKEVVGGERKSGGGARSTAAWALR